jgi:hypothetical protein
MIRPIGWLAENRLLTVALMSASAGCLGLKFLPYPESPVLSLLELTRPDIHGFIRGIYYGLLFSTPAFLAMGLCSSIYVHFYRGRAGDRRPLPPYPPVRKRKRLELVIGELHHQTVSGPSLRPNWLSIGEKGAYTGVIAFGAVGTGKTSCIMYPLAEQILGFVADDPMKRIGGLVLEVKGNFCEQVKQILKRYGRENDYCELSLSDSSFSYNPLHNDLSPYALAYSIASLMNNLWGRGKEPFWQQAYTNLVKFIILLHKLLYDYVTFFDIYECAINPKLLEERLKEAKGLYSKNVRICVSADTFVKTPGLEQFSFEKDAGSESVSAESSDALLKFLAAGRIPFTEDSTNRPAGFDRDSFHRYCSVERWFEHDWTRIDVRLRTSVVEGVSVFLSTFDDPLLRRLMCPPKEAYDAEKNASGDYGRVLPPFSALIEEGKVCALNFPRSADPAIARVIGVLMKLDFFRAVENRVSRHGKNRDFRPVLFLCDEYHSFVTCGSEGDQAGDDKFFALSRESKCIPVVATQSISSLQSAVHTDASLRTLLQCFRTKVFLSTADHTTAKLASDLCGEEEMLRPSYSISENGQETEVDVLTGRAGSQSAGVTTSKSYSLQIRPSFQPSAFYALQNAQAVVLAYDGGAPLKATYCYLKPYYLDQNIGYFEQVRRGEL